MSASSLRDVIRGTDPLFGDFSIDIDVSSKKFDVSSLSIGKRIDLPKIRDLLLMHTVSWGFDYSLSQSRLTFFAILV